VCWFTFTLSRLFSMVMVIGYSSSSHIGELTVTGWQTFLAMHAHYEARQGHGPLKSRPGLETVNKKRSGRMRFSSVRGAVVMTTAIWWISQLCNPRSHYNPDVRATGNGAGQRVGKSRRHPLKIAPSHGGSGRPSNIWILRRRPPT